MLTEIIRCRFTALFSKKGGSASFFLSLRKMLFYATPCFPVLWVLLDMSYNSQLTVLCAHPLEHRWPYPINSGGVIYVRFGFINNRKKTFPMPERFCLLLFYCAFLPPIGGANLFHPGFFSVLLLLRTLCLTCACS